MTGVELIGALLGAHAPLVAAVPADRIKAGALPQGVVLPALLVTRISRTGAARLDGRPSRQTERVQVTVHAGSYAQQQALQLLVLAACDARVGTIAGVAGVAVTAAGGGPDFRDVAASIWMGSEDFRVSYPTP